MSKRKQNKEWQKEKLAEAYGLADLGVIDERELERRFEAAGFITLDPRAAEDAPAEVLTTMFDAPDGWLAALFGAPGANEVCKAYIASLIVGRGLTACGCEHCPGCEHCQLVEAYAKCYDDVMGSRYDDEQEAEQ